MVRVLLQREREAFEKEQQIITSRVSLVTVARGLPEDIDAEILGFIGPPPIPTVDYNYNRPKRSWYYCDHLKFDVSWTLLRCYMSVAGQVSDTAWWITDTMTDTSWKLLVCYVSVTDKLNDAKWRVSEAFAKYRVP